jgi:hypothetical protein
MNMTDQNSEMSTPFTEVATNKIQKQAEQIDGMQKKLKSLETVSQSLIDVQKQLTDIKVAITGIKFPSKQIEELSGNLATGVALLKQPVENKVLHHHHVPKIFWASGVLFAVLCLVFCGWYNTAQKLDQYRANDLKYRYLKLKTNPALHRLLVAADSIYQNQLGFDKAVLQGEDSVRNLIQNLVDAKEREVNELRRKLK